MAVQAPEDREAQAELQARADIPAHIAIIMDGNGRWAKQRGLSRLEGHREGIKSVRDVVEACGELGVQVLTLYTFSQENWRRPRGEVSALMRLLVSTIRNEVDDLMANNVKVRTIGRLSDLPVKAREEVQHAIELTGNNTGLELCLALSYGARREIVDAVQRLCQEVEGGEISVNEIDEALFARYLYTKELPDPDLLIRTSGEARVSNFLLWQLAYTELYITEVLWPAFRRQQLYQAIRDYQNRERRFGLVSEQLQSA